MAMSGGQVSAEAIRPKTSGARTAIRYMPALIASTPPAQAPDTVRTLIASTAAARVASTVPHVAAPNVPGAMPGPITPRRRWRRGSTRRT